MKNLVVIVMLLFLSVTSFGGVASETKTVQESRKIGKLFELMSEAALDGANLSAFAYQTEASYDGHLENCKDLTAVETLTFLKEYVSGIFSAGGYAEDVYGELLRQSLVDFEEILDSRPVTRCYRTVSYAHAFADYYYLKWRAGNDFQLVLMAGGED